MSAEEGPEPQSKAPVRPPVRRAGPLTWGLLALVGVFVGVALYRNWDAVAEDLELLRWQDLLASGLAGSGGAICAGLSWRIILDDLGQRVPILPAATMFFIGQLGKYIPGSVWTAVIQAELGRQRGLRRTSIVMAYAVTLIVSIGAGALVGSLVLLGVTGPDQLPILGLVLIGALVVFIPLVRPRLVNRLLTWLANKAGRTVPELNLSGGALAGALLVSILAWLLLGLHVWFVARPLGADLADLPAVTGAFALAFVAGLLVVPLPAGAGIREAILIATFTPIIGAQAALTVSLVSRLVLLLVDLVLAGGFGFPEIVRRFRDRVD